MHAHRHGAVGLMEVRNPFTSWLQCSVVIRADNDANRAADISVAAAAAALSTKMTFEPLADDVPTQGAHCLPTHDHASEPH